MVGQQRVRVAAMVWIARLSARSPPRLSRWRTVRPLLAGNGLAPASAANAASFAMGWSRRAARHDAAVQAHRAEVERHNAEVQALAAGL